MDLCEQLSAGTVSSWRFHFSWKRNQHHFGSFDRIVPLRYFYTCTCLVVWFMRDINGDLLKDKAKATEVSGNNLSSQKLSNYLLCWVAVQASSGLVSTQHLARVKDQMRAITVCSWYTLSRTANYSLSPNSHYDSFHTSPQCSMY